MRNSIDFVLNGEIRRLDAVDPTLTVMRYLRETERLTGTKEGCSEGDCGACTAVVATLEGSALRYRAVNTCIQLVGMLDGKALITVEHLGGPDGIHPVQDAMIANHATQCGFCTPGIVMSLFAARQHDQAGDRGAIDTLLAGNLCRCTGYTSILNAASAALNKGGQRDCFAARERRTREQLAKIRTNSGFEIKRDGRAYIAPGSLDELSRSLRRHPDATIVAGATDVGLFITKQHRRIETLIDLGKVKELKRIVSTKAGVRIGATVTYERAQAELAEAFPALTELIRRVGSVQVRNLGTLGGNIANGSPIGDLPPALIALDGRLRLQKGAATRELALEDFFVAYGRQDRRASEFVESVFIPKPKPNSVLKIYKVSKRFEQDISAVCGAFHLTLDDARVAITSARICFGGMAGTPKRAKRCEAFLAGKPMSDTVLAEAVVLIEEEFEPVSDWRASAQYRRKVAGNLLRRCFLEVRDGRGLQLSRQRESVDAC